MRNAHLLWENGFQNRCHTVALIWVNGENFCCAEVIAHIITVLRRFASRSGYALLIRGLLAKPESRRLVFDQLTSTGFRGER